MVIYQEQTFEGATVYLNGAQFVACSFDRCTMIVRGVRDMVVTNCEFNSCRWLIDCLFHEADEVQRFKDDILPMIEQSVTRSQS